MSNKKQEIILIPTAQMIPSYAFIDVDKTNKTNLVACVIDFADMLVGYIEFHPETKGDILVTKTIDCYNLPITICHARTNSIDEFFKSISNILEKSMCIDSQGSIDTFILDEETFIGVPILEFTLPGYIKAFRMKNRYSTDCMESLLSCGHFMQPLLTLSFDILMDHPLITQIKQYDNKYINIDFCVDPLINCVDKFKRYGKEVEIIADKINYWFHNSYASYLLTTKLIDSCYVVTNM